MAEANSVGHGDREGDAARHATPDLRITIVRDWYTDYEGTAGQLEQEGLVPAGFAWPRGDSIANWVAGGFRFALYRSRPPGHKGPRRTWLESDHWLLRVRLEGVDFHEGVRRARNRRAAELRAEADCLTTPIGVQEQERLDAASMAAAGDDGFRAFKRTLLASTARVR